MTGAPYREAAPREIEPPTVRPSSMTRMDWLLLVTSAIVAVGALVIGHVGPWVPVMGGYRGPFPDSLIAQGAVQTVCTCAMFVSSSARLCAYWCGWRVRRPAKGGRS